MDNRITKSRLSNFFAYEWIVLIALAVACIMLWELIYTTASVRLTTGQEFKYYYDESVYAVAPEDMHNKTKDALSYDVLKYSYEILSSDYNVLSTRLTVKEGDIIFTENTPDEVGEGKYVTNRANDIVDSFNMYGYDQLVADGESYLKGFLKEGENDALNYANLDENKIDAHFLTRMRKDNRFRSDEEKASGKLQERARIKQLCEEVAFLKGVLALDDTLPEGEKLFYTYRRYEQTISTLEKDEDKNRYKEGYEKATVERYGLKLEMLTGGVEDVREYVRASGNKDNDAKNVVMLVFNFRGDQSDLQYETIGFTNKIIKMFSSITVG